MAVDRNNKPTNNPATFLLYKTRNDYVNGVLSVNLFIECLNYLRLFVEQQAMASVKLLKKISQPLTSNKFRSCLQ